VSLVQLPDSRIDGLGARAVAMAADLLGEAEPLRTRRERAARRRFVRMVNDESALRVTATLTDEVMRVRHRRSAARLLRHAGSQATVRGLGLRDAIGLRLLGIVSIFAARGAIAVVHGVVRAAARGIILPITQPTLANHLRRRRRGSMRLNVNVLGEAVLGDGEANSRFTAVREMIARQEVDYVSVKLSAVVGQIVTVDRQGSLDRVTERLRVLYTDAIAHGTFVNLDMEEFRDLALTTDAFVTVLGEQQFLGLDAGIVLQAYLPEAHSAAERIVAFAHTRGAAGGGTVKVRLVKGANLAMERVEAELHGWRPAPYATKAEVDASYLRLLDVLMRPEHVGVLRIGVASHNLFFVAFALKLAVARGLTDMVDVEMLEGMANAEAFAVARRAGSVLLYAPVVAHDDFPAAVAYLVRRLDENTSAENYLRASFSMRAHDAEFVIQRDRFLAALAARHLLNTDSLRHASNNEVARSALNHGAFVNEPDGDPTDSVLVEAVRSGMPQIGVGGPATVADAMRAVATARSAASGWEALGATARASILGRAADIMSHERAQTIALMMSEGGKTFAEADPEVSEAIDFARYYAVHAARIDAWRVSHPLGVVCVVPPWNFPYAIPAGGVLAALASGNAVVLKPAPETPAIARHLANQLWEAGVPREVLQFVPAPDNDAGRTLIVHPDVDGVILTGAHATAAMFAAWRPDIRLLAETSGKNALIIAASADIDTAVRDLVHSAFGHAGQKCSAASLGIVVAAVYDDPQFHRQLIDAVTSLRVGWGDDPSVVVGPVIAPPRGALERVLTTLDDGESWLVEPCRLDNSGQLWSPGVKCGVKAGSWSHLTEWFGPVLALMRAPDLETALAWQNGVDFGLTAGLAALDVKECEWWLEHIEAGNVYLNRGITGAIVSRQPFGGWRKSAVGPTAKAGGRHYVECLRTWRSLTSTALATASFDTWWHEQGSVVIPTAHLRAERNVIRYRPYREIVVAHDGDHPDWIEFAQHVAAKAGSHLFVADPDTAAMRLGEQGWQSRKIRWWSRAQAPIKEAIDAGVALDCRAPTDIGEVEGPRWFREQSISVVDHRHGNVGAGPHPRLAV